MALGDFAGLTEHLDHLKCYSAPRAFSTTSGVIGWLV